MIQYDVSTSTPPADAPWCEVRLYDHVTRYRRLGSGQPLILLTTQPPQDALWPSVISAMAARHRIYLPEIPSAGTELTSWLSSFMEGVGAETISLAAAGDLCIPALEFALIETDRIQRLFLVPSGQSVETGLTGAVSNNMGSVTLPFLVLRREHPERAALELVTEFFNGMNG